MDEQRVVSSGVRSEPASNSLISGEKHNRNGLKEEDELESKRVKVADLDSDAKCSNLQSDGKIEKIVQQPNLSSGQMSDLPLAPGAEGLGSNIKPSTVVETSTCLPKASSISTEDDRCVTDSGKLALLGDHTVKDDSNSVLRGGQVDVVTKNNSLLKPRETSESGGAESDLLRKDPSLSIPVNEKVAPFQMCSSGGESDSMRRWMEMKRNGFVSGPLGGVAAPSSAVVSTPVEVPAQKQQKNKRRGDSLKKRNEVPRKEQQQVDRFSNITAPSGLLTELKPGILNHVRSKKQVCSIIEALIRNANDDATVGEKRTDLNVRESIREDRALAFKLPSGISNNPNSLTNPEQATALAVEAATVASQWLEFLHQDLSGRLSAVQDSRKKVQYILATEFPLSLSSRDPSSNEEITLQISTTNISGEAPSGQAEVTERHQMRWSEKFDQFNKTLYDEEKDLEHSLNQVKEMQSQCNEGLRQMDEYSPFSSQSSDSSFGKNSNHETTMAVQAAAASIFSTCSFLLSMMKQPPPTSS